MAHHLQAGGRNLCRLGICALLKHLDAHLLPQFDQLVNGCGSVDVSGHHQDLALLLLQGKSQLATGSGFAHTLEASHEDDLQGNHQMQVSSCCLDGRVSMP